MNIFNSVFIQHSCMSHQSEQTGVPSRCIEDHQAAFQLFCVQPSQLDPGPPTIATSPFLAAIGTLKLSHLGPLALVPAGVASTAAYRQPLQTHGQQRRFPQWSCEWSGHGPPSLSDPQPQQVKSCLSTSMVWLSVGSLHSMTTQRASHRSKCLTFLPQCPTSNLDKPVQCWISLALGGGGVGVGLKITVDSQCLLQLLLLASCGETWALALCSSISCAGRMTWPGESSIHRFKGRDRLESCPTEHSACPPSSLYLPLCTISCCFPPSLSPSLSHLLTHSFVVPVLWRLSPTSQLRHPP